MKSQKNFSLDKKIIGRLSNMKEVLSFKSSSLKTQNNDLHRISREKKYKNESDSFISSSDDENDKRIIDELNTNKIKINLSKNKFNKLKLLSKTSISDLISQNRNSKTKISNIKTIYPTIPSRNKNIKNNFKIKLKKTYSPTIYNNSNSLLSRWRENFNKLYNKSMKKTRKEMYQILKKHKIKNLKKKHKIKIESTNQEDQNLNENNTISNSNNVNKDNIYSPPTRKTSNIKETSGYSSSPLKNNYKTYRTKNIFSSDQYSESNASSKSMNRFEFSRNNLKNIKNYKRKVNYKEYMKEQNILNYKWKKKVGLNDIESKYNPDMLKSIDFQYNTIKDEINLIAEGIHYFKISLFGKSDLLNAFNNRDMYSQININKTLEESCALLCLIPKIILKEYYIYCDKFISLPEPKKEYIFNKIITNESDNFIDNIRLLYKIINFMKASFEVYIQLISQVGDEMIISKNDFEVLKAIFYKCRYYIGNLINFANNILKDYNFDKKLISRSKPLLNSIKESLKDENKTMYSFNFSNESRKKDKKKDAYQKPYKIRKFRQDKDLNKMASNFDLQNDEYSQKILRIRKALDNNEIENKLDKIKLKKFGINAGKPMALIFSPLMTRMLKYIKKDSREKIIALRSTEKFFPSKESEKNY